MLDHAAHAEAIIDATKYTLYAFSVVTWTLIFFKIWQLARNKSYNKKFDEVFWNSADLTAAEKLPEEIAIGSEARIARAGFQWLRESVTAMGKTLKFHGKPEELLEHALLVQMQKEQHTMEGGLTILASIGSTAPFVGLFGTVLGIMHAMQQITASGSTSLEVVAGPIGDALVATAIGIAVAVPSVLAYNMFLRMVKQQRVELENFVASFMHNAFSKD
ncbi:MAG: MotA/TolQ/ExbB proton channel family protein [Methylococcales bacterium]|nr:MotA/TolQ/ExbB proton channel family protein [Methylococcales bacterium]